MSDDDGHEDSMKIMFLIQGAEALPSDQHLRIPSNHHFRSIAVKISIFFFDRRFQDCLEIAGKKYGVGPNHPLSVMNISSEINLILKAGKDIIGDTLSRY